ncbi:MAG TPA: Nif11-like leader peptide family natural product precursor [Ktedonobacteraceae bacterium]|nr:Nif11-like leader peptide family natural product precursor [Ktedonobacteraceae bacterium]
MEEQQIKDFVHRVSSDETLRQELAQDPDSVIMREGFSPRVAQIVARLVPHLAFGDSSSTAPTNPWWQR